MNSSEKINNNTSKEKKTNLKSLIKKSKTRDFLIENNLNKFNKNEKNRNYKSINSNYYSKGHDLSLNSKDKIYMKAINKILKNQNIKNSNNSKKTKDKFIINYFESNENNKI